MRVHGRLALVGLLLLGACSSGTEPAPPAAPPATPPPPPPPPPPPVPTLPAAASATIDLDFFIQQLAPTDAPGDNWWYTGSRVGESRNVNDAILLVARDILRAAPNYTPVLQGPNWHWHFTVLENGSAFTTDLMGHEEGNESIWTARVTAPSHGIAYGKWFDGRARLDGSSGSWQIYHLQLDSNVVLGSVTWTHDGTQWSVTLFDHALYVDTTHLAYTVDGAQRALRSVKYLFHSDTVPYEARWDTLSRTGSMLAPVYNAGARACWGVHLENVVCPP